MPPYPARILVIDDDEMLRTSSERILNLGGFWCDSAIDGQTARMKLLHTSYDLVLLDMNMPGESGLDMLRHIRATHPDVIVIMLSAIEDAEQRSTALAQGAHMYLVKPVPAGDLRTEVGEALRRRADSLRG